MAARFWVGGTGTWDSSTTTQWSTSSGGAGGASVPGNGDEARFDGNSGGGTVTVNNASINLGAAGGIQMSAFTGTLDFATNNNNLTIGYFISSGTATRTLNMGNGTWTVVGLNGAIWDCATTTNFTLNRNSSTLLFSCTPTALRNLYFGSGLTYNNVEINNAAVRGFPIVMTNAGAFTVAGTLTMVNVGLVQLPASTTITITGAWTWSGSASSMGVLFTNGAVATLSVAASNTLDYVSMGGITKSGAGSITVNNGYDLGNLTSITVNNPSGGGGVAARVIGG